MEKHNNEIVNFLYRGVNLEMHNRNEGLKPKGKSLEREAQHGEDYTTHGSGLEHGSSIINAILAHQTDSSKYPSSGISTTLSFNIAKEYAIHNFKTGFVYKIDVSKLHENNVELYVVKDNIPYPDKAEDREVILRHKNDEEISYNIVSELIEVHV